MQDFNKAGKLADVVGSKGPADGAAWVPLDNQGPFTEMVGPVFARFEELEPGEPARFGFRVEAHHCNLRHVCHGGMIATFLDIALARGMMAAQGYFSPAPTISLAIDYLAPARLGDWIESRVRIVKMTRNLCFVEAICVGSEGPVVRANAIYKRTPQAGEGKTG